MGETGMLHAWVGHGIWEKLTWGPGGCYRPRCSRAIDARTSPLRAHQQRQSVTSSTPLFQNVGHIALQAQSRSELALGPLGAPEYESRVNCRSRVPLPTFSCRFDHPEWWSLAEVHGCLDVDSPNP